MLPLVLTPADFLPFVPAAAFLVGRLFIMVTSSLLSVAVGDSSGFASGVGVGLEGKVACSVRVTGIVGKAGAGVDTDSVVLPPEHVVRGDGYNS